MTIEIFKNTIRIYLKNVWIIQNQPFLEKRVLKICVSKFTGEHQCLSMISIKFKSSSATLLTIPLQHGCFSCKFAAYFQDNTFS